MTSEHAQIDDYESSSEKTDQPPCIIGVDDDELIRMLLKRAVENETQNLIIVESGEECLKLMENPQNVPLGTVVITDYVMSGINGLELARRIRDAKRDDIIIILCSGGGYMIEAINAAIEAGIIDHMIKKPFDIDVLRQLIRTRFVKKTPMILNDFNEPATS